MRIKKNTTNFGDNNSDKLDQKYQRLPDANHDGFSDQNDLQKFFRKKELTISEINEIFTLADKNKDGLLDRKEWKTFYFVFLKPFLECQQGESFLLSSDDLERCISENSLFQPIKELISKDKTKIEKVCSILSTKIKQDKYQLNLFKYIYLRRASLAWQECTLDEEYIHRVEIFQCGMKIMVPNIAYNENHFNFIMRVADIFSGTTSISYTGKLSFLSFLNLFYKYFQFYQINNWQITNGVITKKQLLNSIKEGNLNADRFNKNFVEKLYPNDKPNRQFAIDFAAFFALLTVQDNVYLFGKNKDGYVNFEEFRAMMDKQGFNKNLDDNIKSINLNYNQEHIDQIQEQSKGKSDLDIQKEEKELLIPYQFQKKTLKNRMKNQKQNDQDQDEKRKAVFDIMDVGNKQKLDSLDLLKLTKYSYMFINFDVNQQQTDHFIYKKDIYEKQKQFNIPIPPNNYEKTKLNQLANICEDYPINFLEFIVIMNYEDIFSKYLNKESGSDRLIQLKDLKEVFKKLRLVLTQQNLIEIQSIENPNKQKQNKSQQTGDKQKEEQEPDQKQVDFEIAVRNSFHEYSHWLYLNEFQKNDNSKNETIKN